MVDCVYVTVVCLLCMWVLFAVAIRVCYAGDSVACICSIWFMLYFS